ncbi:12418_t:CDS:2, partial [Racocetra persica]
PQEQFNELCESEDSHQNNFDQSLKAPATEILSNTIVKSNARLPNISWVWDFMKKDRLNKQVKCEVVTLLDGNSKICNRTFSITTSTTHLGEHLNTIHRIFPNPHKSVKQEKLVFHLAAWIVEDCQPMSVVDGQNFHRFCYEMDPRFKVPGSAQIKTKIKELLLFAEDQLHESENLEWPLLGDDDSESDDDNLLTQSIEQAKNKKYLL